VCLSAGAVPRSRGSTVTPRSGKVLVLVGPGAPISASRLPNTVLQQGGTSGVLRGEPWRELAEAIEGNENVGVGVGVVRCMSVHDHAIIRNVGTRRRAIRWADTCVEDIPGIARRIIGQPEGTRIGLPLRRRCKAVTDSENDVAHVCVPGDSIDGAGRGVVPGRQLCPVWWVNSYVEGRRVCVAVRPHKASPGVIEHRRRGRGRRESLRCRSG